MNAPRYSYSLVFNALARMDLQRVRSTPYVGVKCSLGPIQPRSETIGIAKTEYLLAPKHVAITP